MAQKTSCLINMPCDQLCKFGSYGHHSQVFGEASTVESVSGRKECGVVLSQIVLVWADSVLNMRLPNRI